MEKRVPISLVTARIRHTDNAVVISSKDPLMEDWESIITPGTLSDLKLRKLLIPIDKRKKVNDLIETFLLSGAKHISYESGVTLSSSPFPENSDNIITLQPPTKTGNPVYMGIDFSEASVIGIAGEGQSGRSAFVRDFFPSEITSIVDFAKVDFDELSPTTRKDYGNSIALSFLRNPNIKYLIIDHFSISTAAKRKHHPAFYHDILEQIVDQVSIFRSLGKALVLAEFSKEPNVDTVIQLGNDQSNRNFAIDNVVFPLIKNETR